MGGVHEWLVTPFYASPVILLILGYLIFTILIWQVV